MKKTNHYWILITLICITIAALAVHQIGLYKTYSVKLDQTADIIGTSDIPQGGATTIEVNYTDEGVLFKCDIVAQYQWPYCEIKINLAPKNSQGEMIYTQGYDFSSYTEVFLNLEYQGPSPERVRVYIRNYNEAYTNIEEDENSMKINEIEYEPNEQPGGQFISLNDFNVASWWTRLREIPAEFQGREFTNVPLLEIASAGLAEYGEMQVLVKEITFRRLYISNENLLFSIIAMWLFASMLYLIVQLSLYQIRLTKVRGKQSRLLEIMHALN